LAKKLAMRNKTKQRSEDEMFALIKACKESGHNNKTFCEQQGIGQATFYYWQRKFRENAINVSDEFIPVRVQQSANCTKEIEICYPNGVRVKLPQGSDLSIIRSFIGLL
jgi:hypothetical protein